MIIYGSSPNGKCLIVICENSRPHPKASCQDVVAEVFKVPCAAFGSTRTSRGAFARTEAFSLHHKTPGPDTGGLAFCWLCCCFAVCLCHAKEYIAQVSHCVAGATMIGHSMQVRHCPLLTRRSQMANGVSAM